VSKAHLTSEPQLVWRVAAMDIGDGHVVHAPHPGSPVRIARVDSMPIAMAVRIG